MPVSTLAASSPDPACALLPGSSMFRAPCMSQRRLALIFCVSVLIVLLVALILLCEWGPRQAPWVEEGLGVGRGWGDPWWRVPQGNPPGWREQERCSLPIFWVFLTSGGQTGGGWLGRGALLLGLPEVSGGAAPRFPFPVLASARQPGSTHAHPA